MHQARFSDKIEFAMGLHRRAKLAPCALLWIFKTHPEVINKNITTRITYKINQNLFNLYFQWIFAALHNVRLAKPGWSKCNLTCTKSVRLICSAINNLQYALYHYTSQKQIPYKEKIVFYLPYRRVFGACGPYGQVLHFSSWLSHLNPWYF